MNDEQSVWHLDATGSLVPKWKGKIVYCYALVTATPIKGEPPLPLLEWLSNAHGSKAIRKALSSWWIDVQNLIPQPSAIVVDKSWALLHAVSLVFNNRSLEEQLQAQWEIMIGLISKDASSQLVVRLCVSHYLKSVIRSQSKKSLPKPVGSFLFW